MGMASPLGSGASTVDRVLGKAYQVVKHVYDNLPIIALVAGRDTQLQRIVDNLDQIDNSTLGGQMSVVLAGVSNFRSTYAEAIADPTLPVGSYFTSAQSGELRLYRRVADAPGFLDQGDLVAPISKTLLAGNGGAALIGTTEEDVNVQEALDNRVKKDLLASEDGAAEIGTESGVNLAEMLLRLTPVMTDTASMTSPISNPNTQHKFAGRLAFNATTALLYIATGPGANDAWRAVNGGDAIVPV